MVRDEHWKPDGPRIWCGGVHLATFSVAEAESLAHARARLAACAPKFARMVEEAIELVELMAESETSYAATSRRLAFVGRAEALLGRARGE